MTCNSRIGRTESHYLPQLMQVDHLCGSLICISLVKFKVVDQMG